MNNLKNNDMDYDITIHGIYKMYTLLFEKLGWMILADSRKDKDRTKIYSKSIIQLLYLIEKKEKIIKNKDDQSDLKILSKNLIILKKHAEEDFKNNKINNSNINFTINLKNNNVYEYDVTINGLYKWYQSMFEKLGWMVLAHDKGDSRKIEEYYRTLLKLYKSLELKRNKVSDSDRKLDIEIMIGNLKILIVHTKKDFLKSSV
jgi:hypothetical protein